MLMCSPVLLVLFIAGDDFIRLWMGPEFETKSGRVLIILLVGSIFALSQLIAHAILKGIARHKIYAYILCSEVVVNLLLSIYLAPIYGIEGVAYGTTIPLIIANVVLIPYFTCRELKLNYFKYILESYLHPLLAFAIPLFIALSLNVEVANYFELILLSFGTALAYAVYGFVFHFEAEHRQWVLQLLRIKR